MLVDHPVVSHHHPSARLSPKNSSASTMCLCHRGGAYEGSRGYPTTSPLCCGAKEPTGIRPNTSMENQTKGAAAIRLFSDLFDTMRRAYFWKGGAKRNPPTFRRVWVRGITRPDASIFNRRRSGHSSLFPSPPRAVQVAIVRSQGRSDEAIHYTARLRKTLR